MLAPAKGAEDSKLGRAAWQGATNAEAAGRRSISSSHCLVEVHTAAARFAREAPELT